MTEKLCRKCTSWLPLDAFRLVRGYHRSPCRQCASLRNTIARRKWYRDHKAEHAEKMRRWRAEHPGYGSRKRALKQVMEKMQGER